VWRSEETALHDEGCLSVPDVVVPVERSLRVRVRAQDLHGGPLDFEAEEMEARVIQHEADHLDGVLILDRTSRDERARALRELREADALF
jgi:peptide deformylase